MFIMTFFDRNGLRNKIFSTDIQSPAILYIKEQLINPIGLIVMNSLVTMHIYGCIEEKCIIPVSRTFIS